MNFYDLLEEVFEGQSYNPFAGKINEQWVEGVISLDFLNEHFGHLNTVEEVKNATNDEGLKLYFDWLKENDLLN